MKNFWAVCTCAGIFKFRHKVVKYGSIEKLSLSSEEYGSFRLRCSGVDFFAVRSWDRWCYICIL